MFEETARQWICEMYEEGKLQINDEEFVRQLTKDYARQLEEVFICEIKDSLNKIGKADEFERMLIYDSQYMNKYLNQAIPGYHGFRTNIFDKAKKVILGL
ncbi:MAG: hypothetical protein ABFD82_02200 [Syntrophaceae bacterium]